MFVNCLNNKVEPSDKNDLIINKSRSLLSVKVFNRVHIFMCVVELTRNHGSSKSHQLVFVFRTQCPLWRNHIKSFSLYLMINIMWSLLFQRNKISSTIYDMVMSLVGIKLNHKRKQKAAKGQYGFGSWFHFC